jgi:DNA polymerase-3 subunit gamma/tau
LSPAHASVLNERQQARLQEALSEHLGRATRLQIRVQELVEETPAGAEQRQQKARQQAAESSIETDPHVQALLETFDGTIVAGSIQPLEE